MLDSQKYNIKKAKQNCESHIKNMKFALKIGPFLFKVIVGLKWKLKSNKEFGNKKNKKW